MSGETRAQDFDRDGYVVVRGLLQPDERRWCREVYDRVLSEKIDTGNRRGDLAAGARRTQEHVENIAQVMGPGDLVEGLRESTAYRPGLGIAARSWATAWPSTSTC